MFVKNLSKQELTFKKNGAVLKLTPGVNCVDVFKWDIKDLRKMYGPTILVFIGEDEPEQPVEEVCQPCYADGKTPADADCEACDKKDEAVKEDTADAPVEVKDENVEVEADKADVTVEETKTDVAVEEAKTDVVTEAKAPAKAKAKTGKKNK